MILDTNALSAFFEAERELLALLAPAPVLYLPVIVLGEYRYGLLGSRKRRRLERRLASLEVRSAVLVVDSTTARGYGEIREELRAIAHFDHVRGIRRRTW